MKHPIDAAQLHSLGFGDKEAILKRLATILSIIFLLAACAPTTRVENNVLPTLVSVTVPDEGKLILQGRYFSDGMDGDAANSYVIIGADINGNNGVRVKPAVWGGSRIEVIQPEGARSGFVFVVVAGIKSNGLPAQLR